MKTGRTFFALSMTMATMTGLLFLYSYSYKNNNEINSPHEFSSFSPNKRTTLLGKSEKVQQQTKSESSVILNDPAMNQAWGLAKADVQRAWEVSQGNRNVVVAIIDTGIDINHEDLKDNLWTNPGETGLDEKGRDKATNGIDDDGNGFIDDVHGWNFVSNNNRLDDNHGHGTHVAGIIGAEGGNGVGISGVSPKVSLMILKYYDPKAPGADALRNTVQAIHYAVKMNAKIINYSGGGLEFSQDERDAVQEAEQKGILFVAAAGNEKSNSDLNRYYPADYKLSNIISVTAHNTRDNVLATSNYGVETVDIAAPGDNIFSCLPNNSYGFMTGTSQATGFVSGAAVVVWAHHPEFTAQEVKKYILATGDSLPSLINKTGTSRRLNLYKALTMLDRGIALNGVVAANTTNMDDFEFGHTDDTKEIEKIRKQKHNKTLSNSAEISIFSRSLLENIKHTTIE